jgi:hypothetical protein
MDRFGVNAKSMRTMVLFEGETRRNGIFTAAAENSRIERDQPTFWLFVS